MGSAPSFCDPHTVRTQLGFARIHARSLHFACSPKIGVLELDLGLYQDPYFPKCLREEVSPRTVVGAVDYNIAHTAHNPQGEVAIDKRARWETDEPAGSPEEKGEKLVLTPPMEAEMPNGRSPDGDN